MASISQIIESFRQSGGGLTSRGVSQILMNLLLSGLLAALVVGTGDMVVQVDTLDVAVETSTTLVSFLMFCFIVMIPLKRVIKRNVLLGMILIQTGIMLDMLDEFIQMPASFWKLFGDTIFLLGALVLSYGAANWIVYTFRMSTLDKLTNVYNRRFFEIVVAQFLTRLDRTKEQACLICMDIDNFKVINDSMGHSKGDEVLQVVSRVLRQHGRKSDVICRSGGEEFELLLLGANLEQAQGVAERVMTGMLREKPPELDTLTASIGITQVLAGDTVDTLRQRADRGLYQAKREGKNRICII